MVTPIIMLLGELFEEVLLTLLVTLKWRKINRCIYIHCYLCCLNINWCRFSALFSDIIDRPSINVSLTELT